MPCMVDTSCRDRPDRRRLNGYRVGSRQTTLGRQQRGYPLQRPTAYFANYDGREGALSRPSGYRQWNGAIEVES